MTCRKLRASARACVVAGLRPSRYNARVVRTFVVISAASFLLSGCGPGPDDSSSSSATSTTSTTSGATGSESQSTSGSGTGSASSGTTQAPTTGEVTSTGEATSSTTVVTGSTTGAPTCAMIVGVEDCAQLAEFTPELTLEECLLCQGIPCTQEPTCDAQYPCVEGTIVLRGCCTDDQCEGLTPYCGMFIGTDNICVLHDDV